VKQSNSTAAFEKAQIQPSPMVQLPTVKFTCPILTKPGRLMWFLTSRTD
jgi:hypothetical protein